MSMPAQDHAVLNGSTSVTPVRDAREDNMPVAPGNENRTAVAGWSDQPEQSTESIVVPRRAPIGPIFLIHVVCGVWAWWPLPRDDQRIKAAQGDPSSTTPTHEGTLPAPARATLDLAAFNTPLWVAPPAPPAPPPEVETVAAPPLRLQLLAITQEHGIWSALVYDPDSDALRVLREGDAAGAYTVVRVSEASLDLREGDIDGTLAPADTTHTGSKPLRTLALTDAVKAGAP